MFALGIVLLLYGICYLANVICFHQMAIPDRAFAGLVYVERIANPHWLDLTLIILMIVFGIMLIVMEFIYKKKCSACGFKTEKEYNYCPQCGNKL